MPVHTIIVLRFDWQSQNQSVGTDSEISITQITSQPAGLPGPITEEFEPDPVPRQFPGVYDDEIVAQTLEFGERD